MRSTPVSRAAPGNFRVAGVLTPGDTAAKLGDLGLRVGSLLTLLHNAGDAGAVVICGETRLALDQATAAKILLVPAEGEGN